MKVIFALALVGSLVGCVTEKKAYRKVSEDLFRDATQRNIIAKICALEYPAINDLDTPKVIYSGIDSAAYLELANYSNALVDSMIAMGQDTADMKPGYILKCTPYDSARIIKKFLMNYKPPAIIKTIVKEVRVRDAAFIALKNSEVANCQFENESLQRQLVSANNDIKAAKARQGWMYFWIAIAAIAAAILTKIFWR